MITSETVVEIQKALTAFRKEIKQPLKDKENPFFKSKYVPLENVAAVIDEIAPKHGLAYLQEAFTDESGQTAVVTRVTHASGEFFETRPLALTADKNNAQGQGSVITYARRYQLSAAFGITSDEDDDGNMASTPKAAETAGQKQPATRKQKPPQLPTDDQPVSREALIAMQTFMIQQIGDKDDAKLAGEYALAQLGKAEYGDLIVGDLPKVKEHILEYKELLEGGKP